MKTSAGKKVLKDIDKDKQEIYKDLKELAKEFKKFKHRKKPEDDNYLYNSMLGRAKSYKEQLERAQDFVNIAIYLESFLEEK